MFPVSCFLVLAGFLGCLGLFALAVTKVAAPDGQGHARGFLGGLAALLALFLLCGLGLAGLAATVAAIGLGSVAHWNPIERIEINRLRAPSEAHLFDGHEGREARDEREHGVSARFTVRGKAGDELAGLLHDLVDVDLDAPGEGPAVQHRTDEQGGAFTVYEFHLPISESELERFERDVRVELDGLKVRLPESVDIEFAGAR